MIQLAETYKKRPICFLALWEIDGWKLKAYGIAYAKQSPSLFLIDAARELATNKIVKSASDPSTYGVGFVGIHEGKTSNFIFIDWWANENELHHHVYVSPCEQPEKFEDMTPTGLTACVWDLYVMSFERQAWIDCVLTPPNGPDLEAYLQQRLNIEV